jgi:hypothetical protein
MVLDDQIDETVVSGLYSWRGPVSSLNVEVGPEGEAAPTSAPSPGAMTSLRATGASNGPSAELRLDVDGRYPQMLASGVLRRSSTSRISWVAKLAASGEGQFAGPFVFREPVDPPWFPYLEVRILVAPEALPARRSAMVSFIGPAGARLSLTFAFASPHFHSVDFEFDSVTDETPVLSVDTCAHPNRPATLACETVSVQDVYARAGFAVTTSTAGSVPLSGAGADAAWSNQELHDAMQVFWSHFSSEARWAVWALIATISEKGDSLGGVMFDDIGAEQRQGCAIFNNSFIAKAPAGDADPVAGVERMRFWTACHEIGHCFNLAHSWKKSGGTPWMPLADRPEERSFMNVPKVVEGGERAFFADFAYRFSDLELAFMRHAPASFVRMGSAPWYDDHGFEDAAATQQPRLRLEVRANRDRPLFEFMEPPRLELKLSNLSGEPAVVDRRVLDAGDAMIAVVKREGRRAYALHPYALRCWQPDEIVLEPGAALYAPLLAASGSRGWTIDDPGRYTVQVGLEAAGEQLVSSPLELRVAPPRGYDEELWAQEYFSADVGRVIALQGSRVLTRANGTLRELVDRLPHSRAALHAGLALGNSVGRDHKAMVLDADSPVGFRVVAKRGDVDAGRDLMRTALMEHPDIAVETFGHIGYKARVDRFSDWLAEHGGMDEARQSQETLYDALSRRKVRGRGVRKEVLDEVNKRKQQYGNERRERRP